MQIKVKDEKNKLVGLLETKEDAKKFLATESVLRHILSKYDNKVVFSNPPHYQFFSLNTNQPISIVDI